MAFYNGSTATVNGVVGSGAAANTADFLTKLRAFLVANNWTATDVEAIGSSQADLVFVSDGSGGDENIVLRVQDGTVTNSLSPLNTPVSANRVRVTAALFFDTGAGVVYNEAGESAANTEIVVDDSSSFNFWLFTDTDATHVIIVTQVSGTYYSLTVGRLDRQVYTELAKAGSDITVATPGTPEEVTVALDRTRPTSWEQGKKLMIVSQNVLDNAGNGVDVTAQELPCELVTLSSQSGVPATSVKLTLSRNYKTGAILGQDVLPVGVVKNCVGAGENVAMIYDNGGAVNTMGYTAPNGQLSQAGVAVLEGVDVSTTLGYQDPDDYQGDQIILGVFTYDATASRTFAFRHGIPRTGRISTANGSLDEMVLSSGDRWLAFAVGSVRVAIGKVN